MDGNATKHPPHALVCVACGAEWVGGWALAAAAGHAAEAGC